MLPARLRLQITESIDEKELKNLCFELEVDRGNDIRSRAEGPANQLLTGGYSGGVSILSEGQWQQLQR